MTQKVTGRAVITVDGVRLESRPGATLDPGGVSRSTVVGDSGVHGFQEAVRPATVQCTVSHKADVSLAKINGITSASVLFETDSGKAFLLSNAWTDGASTLGSTGEVPINFTAAKCEEL
jgi:hypothetical protein